MPFTPAQQAAIEATNRELLVSAAAGSGKTRVLIERIYHLLKSGELSLDRLLIVTFTHAAAAEMRERLQARMAEAADSDRRMRRQAELLETAQISTLHSFCQKLLREYFHEADIDPAAALADEPVSAALFTEAKDAALLALYERAAAADADAAALTAKFDEKQIDKMLLELYPFLMALPDPFGWLAAQAHKTYAENDLQGGPLADTLLADCRILSQGVREVAARCAQLPEHPLMAEGYRATILSDGQAALALDSAVQAGLAGAGAAARAFTLQRLPTVRGLEGEPAALRDQYKALRERMKKLAAAIAARVPADLPAALLRLNAMQPALRGLAAFVHDTDERYLALKRERALLDFSDLERMALRILQNPLIRAEIAARFDGVFVDEYQDISGVQEAILNAVKRDVSRETMAQPQRYFYVGDVKQSIYRFRQADPSLFRHKAKTFAPDEGAPQRRITLNANFRSRGRVLAAVNRVLGRVMRADVTEIEYDAEARLYAGAHSQGDPPMSLHLFTQPVRAAQRAALQAQAIAREIKRRVGQRAPNRDGIAGEILSWRDIAILGPKMKSISTVLEKVLTEQGIPVYCEDRASALESEEIAQTLNHLRLLDNIADDLSLIAWMRSPAGGFGEKMLAQVRLHAPQGSYLEAVRAAAQGEGPLARQCALALDTLARERFLLMETPLDQYLWGWLTRSGLYAFFGCQPNGAQRQANLRMLCEKAGEHVKHRGGGLGSFLRSVAAQAGVRDSSTPTVLSPWEDVVRVMTIHKSKGLEFPVVFVMGLEEGFGGGARGALLAAHPRLGVALPYVNETARITGDTLLKGAIDLRLQSENRAERARLLYVAMTRARDELILLGCGDQLAPEDAANGFAQNGPPSAYAVSGAGSMLDWVCQCADAGDAVAVCDADGVFNSDAWNTGGEDTFSTLSTGFPQKNDVWKLVFHTDEAEVLAALKAARGQSALTDEARRTARLNALAEDARALAAALHLSHTAGAGEGQPAARGAGSGIGAGAQPTQANPTAAGTALAVQGAQGAHEGDATGGHPTQANPADAGTTLAAQGPHGGVAASGHGIRVAIPASASGASLPAYGMDLPDPVAPPLHFAHRPFKLGATALARAQQQLDPSAPEPPALAEAEDGETAAPEGVELKRLPLPLTRPRMMADLPAQPAFLRAPAEQTGVRRGVAVHKALSMVAYPPLRGLAGSALLAQLQTQLDCLSRQRILSAEEATLVDPAALARFFESPCGREALAAVTVQREWGFNLRLPEQNGLIVQGVIDLCYLQDGAWSLVDYKTDRVKSPAELWTLYGTQMALYRRALTEATGLPVRGTTLFSLSLGAGDTR
jgi:ATP-dependent helicase/nuclease subunit A